MKALSNLAKRSDVETILIVDDCLEDRETFRRLLSRGSHERQFKFLEAETIAEGLVLYRDHRPACVLLDYSLPDGSGLEFLQSLSDGACVLPVVMLTGVGNEGVAVEAMKIGVQDYLTKGIVGEASLRRSVSNAIDKSKLLNQLDEARAETAAFAQTAAHDLKAPLRQMRSFSDLLRDHLHEQAALDEDAREFLQFISSGAAEMGQLVDDLLTYAKAGRSCHPLEPVDLGEVMRVVESNLGAILEEANGLIQVGDMPTIIGDRTGLVQLFQNVVSNGLKYHGDEPPTVSISADREAEYWHFRVQDNGIGIAPEYHEQIFEAFRRLHTKREYDGTGIGLATCTKVIEQHRGRVWVESSLGQGAVFHVSIPDRAALHIDGN